MAKEVPPPTTQELAVVYYILQEVGKRDPRLMADIIVSLSKIVADETLEEVTPQDLAKSLGSIMDKMSEVLRDQCWLQ